MERELISRHTLLSDHSITSKLKTIVTGWVIFLIIFIGTRLDSVQSLLFQMADTLKVSWITDAVDFICRGLWIFFIPMVVGTILTLMKRQTFDEIRMYRTGVEFVNNRTGKSDYQDYGQVGFSNGKFQQSFYIDAPEIKIKHTEYAWSEFTNPDVLRNNIERYSSLS